MAKNIYKPYTLKAPGRALYASIVEAGKPPTVEAAKTKYSVTLGLEEEDAKALFEIEAACINEAGFGPFSGADNYQLCVISGKKAAERALAGAALAARGKPEEEAFKIRERAEKRAELVKDYAGILTASSRVAFHDRFTDRYMNDLDAKERENADRMGFRLAVLAGGKVIALDTAHLFAEYKDKFYRGAFIGGTFNLSPWLRKTPEAKDGVSAYINGLIFVKDGERLASGPNLADSFAHYQGMVSDYSPSQAAQGAFSAADF
jgi:hypothetical protein